jgi:putative (di)nucleoside polyphosphate hydrolase
VYQRALQELSRFITWPANGDRRHSSRYLRQPHERRGQGGNGSGGNKQAGANAANASSKAVAVASKAIADAAGSSKMVLAQQGATRKD